jgi:Zn-dependent membrane protease YugP
MYFDPLYLIVMAIGMGFSFWAQRKVRSTFEKYAQVRNASGLNGLDVANRLMQRYGLQHLKVNRVPGQLTDFYNPADKSINLSEGSVQPSIGALAVVAHELGHAVQDKENYGPMRVRGSIVGIANIGSNLGTFLVMIGLLIQSMSRGPFGFYMAVAGLIMFAGAVAFSLVTLPVEFNASSRARQMLVETGLVSQQEAQGVKEVLDAAAWTYVAAAATAVLNMLYFAFRVFGAQRD